MNEKIPINNLVQNNRIEIPVKLYDVKRQYTFEQKITKGEETTDIRYDFTANFLRNKSDMSMFCRINRISPIYINDEEADLIIDELAYETGKVFYPLVVQMDDFGKFQKIINYTEISERWKKQREKISQYFAGDDADKYLALMDQVIRNEAMINKTFRHDLFINTFFAPVYKRYPLSAYKKNYDMYFPLAGKARSVIFSIDDTLSDFLTDTGSVEILQSGKCTDERSAFEIEWQYDKASSEGQTPVEINYTGRYTLEAQSKLIHSIETKWEFTGEISKITEIKITPSEGFNPNQSFIVEDYMDSSKKESGFWKDFWDVLRGK